MNYKDYFEKRDAGLPKPTWVYGDRVFSKFKGTPTIGSVIRETLDENGKNTVLMMADLPVRIHGVNHSVFFVKPRDVRSEEHTSELQSH